MSMKVEIQQVENGYIVIKNGGVFAVHSFVYSSLDELIRCLYITFGNIGDADKFTKAMQATALAPKQPEQQ